MKNEGKTVLENRGRLEDHMSERQYKEEQYAQRKTEGMDPWIGNKGLMRCLPMNWKK